MAAERGRAARPGLEVGICHTAGLDYVSCSPFRVPIARVAAAQAATLD
jgi:pyruvate,orthophosphate dikinase